MYWYSINIDGLVIQQYTCNTFDIWILALNTPKYTCIFRNHLEYSRTSLSQTRWNCLKTSIYQSIWEYLKDKWLGLTNQLDTSIVFEITVFEIPKCNCIYQSNGSLVTVRSSWVYCNTIFVVPNILFLIHSCLWLWNSNVMSTEFIEGYLLFIIRWHYLNGNMLVADFFHFFWIDAPLK